MTELWRYPVKSMLGERREHVTLDDRGVLGDRRYAVRASDGKLGSGKNTRRFRRVDGLFGFRAQYDGAVPVVTFPDGRRLRGDDPGFGEQLRDATGHDDVELAKEAGISHFDTAPLHLLTDASVSWLAAELSVDSAGTTTKVDARRARPNLVIATGEPPGPVENDWVGQCATVGPDVVIAFMKLTERCVMVNNAQDDLIQSSEVLRTITAKNNLAFGIYATVVQGGTIRLGDEFRLLDDYAR